MHLLHRFLHQVFRVLIGNQHIPRHEERKSHEILRAEDIGDRLMPAAPLQHRLIAAKFLIRDESLISVREERLIIRPAGRLQKEPCIELPVRILR